MSIFKKLFHKANHIEKNAPSVQNRLSAIFSGAAAGVDFKSTRDDLLPLVEFAADQAERNGSMLRTTHIDWTHFSTMFRALTEEVGSDDSRYLYHSIMREPDMVDPVTMYRYVILHWDEVKDSTYTYRMLRSLVNVESRWSETPELEKAFDRAMSKISMPEKELHELMEFISAQFFLICAKWKDFFCLEEIKFYC